MKVAIIGGGASGVLAALRLKFNNSNIDVTIFEKNSKPLKKLGVTGNGRCNLGNEDISSKYFLHESIVSEMIDLGYKDESINFFNQLGLFMVNDFAGRIYPKSNQAVTVVELLMKELYYKHVNLICDIEINEIKVLKDNKFLINNDIFDKVIICTGSNAGFSNDEITLYKNLPFKFVKDSPALVGFKVIEDIKVLFGVKQTGTVSLNGHKAKGEVVFKEDGVSGICVMDLSVYYDQKDNIISFDFLDEYSDVQLKKIVERKIKNDPYVHLHNLMFGSVNNKLLGFFNKGYPNIKVTTAPKEMLDSYLLQFKDFRLTIKDTYDLKTAHVSKGGIDLNELELFETKKIPNLFVCGDATNQAGICGGYNLWFAFTSGLMVADKICK